MVINAPSSDSVINAPLEPHGQIVEADPVPVVPRALSASPPAIPVACLGSAPFWHFFLHVLTHAQARKYGHTHAHTHAAAMPATGRPVDLQRAGAEQNMVESDDAVIRSPGFTRGWFYFCAFYFDLWL